jgi:predicted LPLAT superfamily acyltransferase
MKSEGSATAAASWAGQRERSNLPALRAMRWIAVAAGRRATRLLLYPIALYFFFASRGPRRNSRRYLGRALGRPPTWRDGYRHVYTFCATVLDRVYLLREQFDEFAFEASGKEAILAPAGRGEGLLACGAHFGSFEALRMVGVDKGLKVAMIMYEDNARLINDTLAAIAPNAELHTIPLGRVDAMLALRRWLEDGGLAGMLPTAPAGPQPAAFERWSCPSSARRRASPTGRFASRAAARVVFMAGLYRGGNRYDLRFSELADFSAAASAGERDALIGVALARYVATLEALCRERPTTGSTSSTSGTGRGRCQLPIAAASDPARGAACGLAAAAATSAAAST